MQCFDTHAHLNLPPLLADAESIIDECRRTLAGVAVVGVDAESSEAAVRLAEAHPGFVHAVVGIQPNSLNDVGEGEFDRVRSLFDHPGVVAVGETGLDLYWKDVPLPRQIEAFHWHMGQCLEHDLPMVIHMRECAAEIAAELDGRDRVPRGVMHSYTGDVEHARRFLDHGLMISLAGMVTFKNASDLRRVAAMIPMDRLLIETDSPYLSPEPMRGRRPNHPSRVVHVAECLAGVRGLSLDEVAETTTNNARQFFGLSDVQS